MHDSERQFNRREFCRSTLLGLPGWSFMAGDAGEAKGARSCASGSERRRRSTGAGVAAPAGDQRPAQGILQLRLQTHRLAEVRAFYREKLLFPIQEESGDSITFQAGASRLTFIKTLENGSRPFYHFAFNIPENKLSEARQWLSERTPLAADGKMFHFPRWNAHAIYFWDPAGNLGELIARHDLPNARTGAFGAADILYTSEIGLVVKDVPAAVRALKGGLKLSTYREGSNDFQTLGDEHRLLIVVREGRPWMDRESAIFPTAATLHGDRTCSCELTGHPYTVGMRAAASR
jgi:catechol-2,3-dioxygenase